MSSQAQIHRVEEVEQFRNHLATFLSAAEDSLLAVDLELRRFVDWLRGEQPRRLDRLWAISVEKVAEARGALQRKLLVLPGERPPDVIDERKELRRWEQRRDRLQEKIELVRKWSKAIESVLDDYRGDARQLANLLEGDPPVALRFLDALLAHVRAYLDVVTPTSPRIASSEHLPAVADAAADVDNKASDAEASPEKMEAPNDPPEDEP